MRKSQNSFSVAHQNVSHSHTFQNLKNVVDSRRSFQKNNEIDDYLRMRTQQNLEGANDQNQGYLLFTETGKQVLPLPTNSNSLESQISNQTFQPQLPPQIFDADPIQKIQITEKNLEEEEFNVISSPCNEANQTVNYESHAIRSSHNQISESDDSDLNTRLNNTAPSQYEQKQKYQKCETQQRRKRKEKYSSNQSGYNEKQNAFFPASIAYVSNVATHASKKRSAKKNQIKGLPYREPVFMAGRRQLNVLKQRQTYQISLNQTSQSAGNQSIKVKNRVRMISNEIKQENVYTKQLGSTKNQKTNTPNSSSHKIRQAYFNSDEIPQAGHTMQTQQNFNSRSTQRKNNLFDEQKRKKDSIVSNRTESCTSNSAQNRAGASQNHQISDSFYKQLCGEKQRHQNIISKEATLK